MNATQNPPPGWDPDPSGQAPFRYWDGGTWTEHTNNGAPAPVQAVQYAPQPGGPAAPGAPAAPGYLQPGAPVAPGYAQPAAAGATGPLTPQGLLEGLQKFEGFAVMVAAGLLFLIATFLPWGDVKVQGFDAFGSPVSEEDSFNGWSSSGPWMLLGYEVDLPTLQKAQATGKEPDGTTDMLIMLPLLLAAVGAAAAPRLGKKLANGREIAAGAAVGFGVFTVAEVFSLSGSMDDLEGFGGGALTASVGIGGWIGAIAAAGVAVGGIRMYMAGKQP